ncbi:MAG: hypothetical protein V1754_03425 [Pseudomonadota bacterium]
MSKLSVSFIDLPLRKWTAAGGSAAEALAAGPQRSEDRRQGGRADRTRRLEDACSILYTKVNRLLPLFAVSFAVLCCGIRYEGELGSPIPIRMESDIPLLDITCAEDEAYKNAEILPVALDSSSPLTILDGNVPNTSGKTPAVGRCNFLGIHNANNLSEIPFEIFDYETYQLEITKLGKDPGISVRGLLGALLLSNFAIQLRYDATPTLAFSSSIPGSREDLALGCDTDSLFNADASRCTAVFSTPLFGGGSVNMAGENIDLSPSRLLVPVCLLPDGFDPNDKQATQTQATGLPATALVATGMSISIISRSSFERLRALRTTLTESAPTTLHLPSGPESVTITELDDVVAVASETRELGPCFELARRQRLAVTAQENLVPEDIDQLGTSTAQVKVPLEFAILGDDAPLFRGLRQELSPRTSDVEVILGGNFFSHFELDLDYPSERILLRCRCDNDDANCETTTNKGCFVFPFCEQNPTSQIACKNL